MSGKSNPLAATSVATNTSFLPERNNFNDLVLSSYTIRIKKKLF